MDTFPPGEVLKEEFLFPFGVVAELAPVQANRPDFVPKSELLVLAKRGPHVDLERFRADLDSAFDR